MISDIEVMNSGIEVLIKFLGDIDAERFLVMVNKEKMNYTKWRKSLCVSENLHKINDDASVETAGFEAAFKKASII